MQRCVCYLALYQVQCCGSCVASFIVLCYTLLYRAFIQMFSAQHFNLIQHFSLQNDVADKFFRGLSNHAKAPRIDSTLQLQLAKKREKETKDISCVFQSLDQISWFVRLLIYDRVHHQVCNGVKMNAMPFTRNRPRSLLSDKIQNKLMTQF